ncbi:MAG: hypothetical protein PHI55_14020 [Burkholderiaceae bacterium]|nr:hypothetical protein [Burkholderiaceae bacterium]
MILRSQNHLACIALLALASISGAQTLPAKNPPFLIAPTIEGLMVCDAAAQNLAIPTLEKAVEDCQARKAHGAAAVRRLLDQLEPGGPQGQVQVGYTVTLELLKLYRRTPKGWAIDDAQVTAFLDLITQVPRPVVLYLSAGHFDSHGAIVQELEKDPANWMQLRDGTVPQLGYFGYRILPFTLRSEVQIPVNRYRFEALRHIAKRVQALPVAVQKRIVAYTLAGEVHQLFPDFENGMGRYQDIRVTDYHPASVAAFRRWLATEYGSVQALQQRTGLAYPHWDAVPAPSKDIRSERLDSFGEHYDAFADGTLPLSGWLWDPQNQIQRLELFVNGQRVGPVARGLHRLDVYRAVGEITDPNVGYRVDYDYRALPAGHHLAQIVATVQGKARLLAAVPFVVVPRDQSKVPAHPPRGLTGLAKAEGLPGLRSWLDLPRAGQDLYHNPLARDWNRFRAQQVRDFLGRFHAVAQEAGLPADKLYSHQILPQVNPSWNPQLFAIGESLDGKAPWKTGLNLYGGATDSAWVRDFLRERGIRDYGVPEFHPQQWKSAGVHLAALRSHQEAGARFVSPYYFSVVPQRFKGAPEHGVNRLEISPNNPKDGSDQLYQAIRDFAQR